MDSAQSDTSLPKLDISAPPESSSSPGEAGAAPPPSSSGNAGYYQPPSGEPTPVAPQPATTGVVQPAPGSPVLGSNEPARPNLPTMSLPSASPEIPADSTVAPTNPTAVQSIPPAGQTPLAMPAEPPTVSAEASANQVQQRMQEANAGAGKKRSPLLLILGVIAALALAAAAAFWWWSNNQPEPIPVELDQTITRSTPTPAPADTTVVTEGVQPREGSTALVAATDTVTDETPNTAEIFGLVCKYENVHPAGTVLFYEPASGTLHRLGLAEGLNVYSMKVPAGEYMAFFEPANPELPLFAFTQYVNCGLDPAACTDHSMALFSVEAGQEYGQIDLCDPQYAQDGLPQELQYENL